MFGFFKSSGPKIESIADLEGHYFKYLDLESHYPLMEVWIQEAEDEEDGYYELITTQFADWGNSDSSQLIDSTGMIRRDPEFKGRPACIWLPPHLREAGLSGKMGKIPHPVNIMTKTKFRGLKVWHVQYPDTGRAAYIYFDQLTGIKVAQSGCGILAETSLEMKLPRWP